MDQVATPTRSQAGTSSVPPSRPTSPPTISKASSGPAGAPGRNDEHRRARREQLRNFYGLKYGAGAGAAGPSTPKEGDVLDIDSGAFDAGAYYQDLIQKSSLAELMKKAVALNAEMGDLQSSRHSLVYNHHHKLFSAGDAIQVLNTRTPQLISIVTSLQDSFSSISQLADSVALPDLDTPASTTRKDEEAAEQGLEEGDRAIRRMRLMRTAELPVETIRAVLERVEAGLEEKERAGDVRAGAILREGRQMLPSIPPIEEAPTA
ncbi:Vps51/Vps67-domain-containing protein [Dioszegia hungarica]|uniref:Vacuolar protein sorting-associated protein 51 homolog n=1 Tax=Dioszegia hungarica TaxID=4972 RepID=A0AA38H4C7_9TREE|nr:Vps51/Vps67-domain-containing protein [Dioszegia hungarica]KAI9633470.1 Vps51/Vps67-domain-containing protein [Dioszegia hungarica]